MTWSLNIYSELKTTQRLISVKYCFNTLFGYKSNFNSPKKFKVIVESRDGACQVPEGSWHTMPHKANDDIALGNSSGNSSEYLKDLRWPTILADQNYIICLHPKVTSSQKLPPPAEVTHNTINVLHLNNFQNYITPHHTLFWSQYIILSS